MIVEDEMPAYLQEPEIPSAPPQYVEEQPSTAQPVDEFGLPQVPNPAEESPDKLTA